MASELSQTSKMKDSSLTPLLSFSADLGTVVPEMAMFGVLFRGGAAADATCNRRTVVWVDMGDLLLGQVVHLGQGVRATFCLQEAHGVKVDTNVASRKGELPSLGVSCVHAGVVQVRVLDDSKLAVPLAQHANLLLRSGFGAHLCGTSHTHNHE